MKQEKILLTPTEVVPPPYKLSHLIFEGTTFFVFLGLLTFFWYRLIDAPPAHSAIAILLACVLGLIASDVMSGIVHWAADTWGSFNTPFFGPWLIRSFREHHADPQSITRHGFIETNGANSAGGVILIVPAIVLLDFVPLISLFLMSFAIGISLTNQVHKWSHSETRGPIIRFFQSTGLILSPEHHQGHHSGEYNRHYCITLGIMNHPLDRISFFRFLESKITDWTGAVPRAK
ncbi:MAG: fatty acid desaturase family protein [Bdellovibrionales bacterium]|nr:fatty acid desaturase family protein [Bdellovibrionales bacterium]